MQQEPNKMKPNQKDELEKKTDNEFVRKFAEEKYKYGFTTEVHTDIIERGLNEDVIRLISSKKDEPEWLLEFRLKAYRHWLTLEMPTWAHLRIPEIEMCPGRRYDRDIRRNRSETDTVIGSAESISGTDYADFTVL